MGKKWKEMAFLAMMEKSRTFEVARPLFILRGGPIFLPEHSMEQDGTK